MSVARVGLSIELTVNNACTDVFCTDDTGSYNASTNPDGYGLPTGATSASVTGLVIVVTLSDGSYLTYTFTIASNVISACTLSLSGGTATAITSELASTVFPLTNFSLFDEDYLDDMPTLGNDIVNVDYTITGRIDPVSADTAYSYTTSQAKLVECEICCCVTTTGAELDLACCDCNSDELWNFILMDTYLTIASYATNVGNVDNAKIALDKAIAACDCGCGDC